MSVLGLLIKVAYIIIIGGCFVLVAAFIARRIVVSDLLKKLSTNRNFYFYGWVPKLTNLQELNIWIDPLYLRVKYPTLCESDFKRIVATLTKMNWDDTLYVCSSLAVIIRVPEDCCISFGNNCFEYKEFQSIIEPSSRLVGASKLESRKISEEAVLIKTVRRVS